MPKSLYLSLVSGRSIHVTDDWDGAEPTRLGTIDAQGLPLDNKGIEAGPYYRDLHNRSGSVSATTGSASYNLGGVSSVTAQQVPVAAAIVPTGVTTGTVGGTASGLNQYATSNLTTNVIGTGFNAKVSDEIANAKPRTWQKVCTWLVFTSTTGTKFHWRSASVDGWHEQPPIE